MKYIRVKGWDTFQQYKDRDPKWIKLYRSLLEDYEFTHLTDAQKYHYIGLLLLAAKLDNKIPADDKWIADRMSAKTKIDLKPLFDVDFIELYNPVQNCTETYKSVPREEKRRGEEKRVYGELSQVLLTDDEYKKLKDKHGEPKLLKAIEVLDGYIASKGAKYKSHYATMKADSWVWERVGNVNQEGGSRWHSC